MARFNDALRGYGHEVFKRDHFRCQYCGLDGQSFEAWLSLSVDHLLPPGHPQRNNPEFMVTACKFCNTADNHYFRKAKERGLRFDGLTRKELVEQRLPYVKATRDAYYEFWKAKVSGGDTDHSPV